MRPFTVDVDLVTLGPAVQLRSHTTDFLVLRELLVDETLAPIPADLRVDTVLDLGANIGLSFRWLHSRWPDARFVCIEPEAGNLEVLRANVRPFADQVEVIGACIGGYERETRLGRGNGEYAYHILPDGASDQTHELVDVMTMDTLLASTGIERVGLLKCDIEGAESELFDDCRSWIDRVDCLSVECHSDSFNGERLLAVLADNEAAFDLRRFHRNAVTLVRSTCLPANPRF